MRPASSYWRREGRLPRLSAYGYRARDLLAVLGPLVAALVVPPLLVFWARRRALRARSADPAAVWFGYWRLLQALVTGTSLAWLSLAYALPTAGLGEFLLGRPGLLRAYWIGLSYYLLPPALVGVLCAVLSHPVMARVRGAGWTRGEMLRQGLWAEAAVLLPLLLILLGLNALARGEPRWAGIGFFAAFASYLVASRRSMRAHDLVPHALTTGELRDRLFDVTEKAGVRIQQLYLVPGARARLGNAFAVLGGHLVLTDTLCAQLTKRELDGVLAHELAHLKRRHPRALLLVFVAVVVAGAVLSSFLPPALRLGRWGGALLPALAFAAVLTVHLVSRRFEVTADADAVAFTGDAEGLITALVKLSRLNLLPLQWGPLSERTSTHPSTLRRARAIARRAGLPEAWLGEILERGETGSERYALPEAVLAGEGRLFSTEFKGRLALRNLLLLTAVLAVTPALVAVGVSRSGLTGLAVTSAYTGGVVLTAVLYAVFGGVLAGSGDRAVERRLRARLERHGLIPESGDVLFVGLAPAAGLRLYEGFFDWDIGLLFLAGERVVYFGEQARFALRRDQVRGVGVREGAPRWWFGARVEVAWRDDERGAGGTLSLAPTGSSLWRRSGEARALAERLRDWREGRLLSSPGPPTLGALGTPDIGAVTSTPLREVARPGAILGGAVFTAAVAWGVSLLLGSPFAYPMATSVSLSLLPARLYRERAAVDTAVAQAETEGP